MDTLTSTLQVCSRCHEIFGHTACVSDALAGKLTFSRDSEYLVSSQAKACPLCVELVRSSGSQLPDDPKFSIRLEDLSGDTPKVHISAAWQDVSFPVSYLIYAERGDPASTLVHTYPVNLDVASIQSFEQAKEWVGMCDNHHPECTRWMSTVMPLRLIDVMPTSTDRVSLVETSGQFLRFAALSYCWGKKAFLTTRTTNLSQHLQGIFVPDLPQTIQDAIHCTRRLGLPYIWVDALCIVQDDETEKHREISRMKDFYRSAYLTISASSAGACQDGFLQRRENIETCFEINLILPSGTGGRIKFVKQQFQPHPRMILCPGAEPVSYRAWTTQESLLSSRVLIYGRLQLFWLCRRRFAADGGNMSWQEFKNHAAWQKLGLGDRGAPFSESELSSPFDAQFDRYHGEWTSLISAYSGRSLSYQHDKLPALSAVASLFQDKMHDEYVCGLWRRSLLYDMTWAPARHWSAQVADAKNDVGPSWSWISYPDLVQYVGRWNDKEEIAKVISVAISLLHPFAPLGQVKHAEVRLEGPCVSLQLQKGVTSDWLLHTTSEEMHQCTLAAIYFADYSQETDNLIHSDLYCVVLHGPKTDGHSSIGDVTGLVLTTAGSDAYKRVGRFQSYSHSWPNRTSVMRDGCICRTGRAGALQLRDWEVKRSLLTQPRRSISII